MINFGRSFDLAWERMVVILFRPFDIGKWFTIGLSAFLAGLLQGGNGFNASYNHNSFDRNNWSASYNSNIHQLNSGVSNLVSTIQAGIPLVIVAVIAVIVLCFIALFYWLGARGQFLLLDNVVRNRGAISLPWRAYSRLGNSLFCFYLLYLLAMFVVFAPFMVAGFFAALPLFREHRWPSSAELPIFIALGVAYVVVAIVFGVLLFLFRELGVPLMFRNGLMARAAFAETWRLIGRHPGTMILFVLLRIALFFALAVLSVLTCCCFCLGALPYIGTVMLLPALIYIKCFTLDVLAQFGPEYDVWTVDLAPVAGGMAAPMPIDPASPPPPPV